MSIEITESPGIILGPDAVEKQFILRGTESETEAKQALLQQEPLYYDPLGTALIFWGRQSPELEYVGGGIWKCRLRYSAIDRPDSTVSTFSGTIAGGTKLVKVGYATVTAFWLEGTNPGNYPSGTAAPIFQGKINVDPSKPGPDGVLGFEDGQECHFPFTISKTIPRGEVDGVYLHNLWFLAALRAVNNAPMSLVVDGATMMFEAKELRFFGAEMNKRSDGDWEFTFHFGANPHMADIPWDSVFGDTAGTKKYREGGYVYTATDEGIYKAGWDYLWLYIDNVTQDDGTILPMVMAAYVEQVCYLADLTVLGV